jgi:P27 family predicted phage terminase small subunit
MPEDARPVWHRMVDLLDEMGVLTTADINTLARYCVTWARWRRCCDWIEQNGEFIDDAGRNPRLHPMAKQASKLAVELHAVEREFGLTPASRPRIGASKNATETKKSSLAKWAEVGTYPERFAGV